jgi:O-antigen/teichoic acid export membrane protein
MSLSLKKLGSGLLIQIVIKFLAVGLGLYTARWSISNIDTNTLSDFNILLAFSATLIMILNFGLHNILQRHYTLNADKAKKDSMFSTMMILRILGLPLGLLLVVIFLPLSGVNNLDLGLKIFAMLYILLIDINFKSITDALGTSWKFSITDFISKTLIVVLLALSVKYKISGIEPVDIFVGVSIFSSIIALIIDANWQKPNYTITKMDFSILKENKKSILYLGLTSILASLYIVTDKLFLKHLDFPDSEIVAYSNAYRLYELATIIPGITTPVISSFANKRINSTEMAKVDYKFYQILNKIKKLSPKKSIFLQYLLINISFSLVVTVLLVLIGPLVIKFIDSDLKYPLAFDVLPILALSLVPVSIIGYLGVMIILFGGEKNDFISYIFIAIFGLITYSIFIPAYGAIGASISTLLIFIFDIIIKLLLIRKTSIFKH